jgi:hypothetical protein
MKQKHAILISLLVVGLILVFGIYKISHSTDQKKSAITQVQQGLAQSNKNGDPIASGTANITNPHYFDKNTWLVASVVPANGEQASTAVVIMQLVNKQFQVFAGPGSLFTSDALSGAPADVVQYVNNLGYTQQ